jgi:hypothetical protein
MRGHQTGSDADVIVRPIDGGIHEDAVAMPGGGQASIDDLEEAGAMTPDLMRKARPEVWEYEEAAARARSR